MFEKMMERFRAATNPYRGFLGELWTICDRDAGRAVLLARWSWLELPEELVGQAAMLERQAKAAEAQRNIDAQVNTYLGRLGIHPGATAGPSFGSSPAHAMFISIMGTIRAYRGDPPVSPGMVQFAEPVLTGRMDPVEALVAAAPPFVRPQLAAAIPFIRATGMYMWFRLAGIVEAAFSLPRERILTMLPQPDRTRLALREAYDKLWSVPPGQELGNPATKQLVFRGIIAAMIENKALPNCGMTPDDVMNKLSFDDLVRRLTELGWLAKLKTA